MGFKDTLHLFKGRTILLGNEAIARGALEAGVGVATAYPGTPSSEIVESLMQAKEHYNIYVEWSINEKVAFEVAYGAAISGVKALVAMKHVGLNVAADPFMSSAYTGVRESLVIVTADDPSMLSSQNEQDNRYYGVHAYVPVFEPYGAEEAKDVCKFAFNFSSKFKHPVLLRTTTRISHTRAPVELGEIPRFRAPKGKFEKEDRFVVIPAIARRNRKALLEKWARIEEEVNRVPFNRVEGEGRKLIVAPGLAYSYVRELVGRFNLQGKVKVLKIGTPYPIPKELLLKTVEDADGVLVVEELEPVVETQVKVTLHDAGHGIEVHGKDWVGIPFELSLDRVALAIGKFLGEKLVIAGNVPQVEVFKAPPRPPTLCPGCPYRPLFYETRMLINQEKIPAIASGDIGCYSLGFNPPFKLQDIILEMGGSIGIGNGLSKVVDDVVISIIGDSTFYHAGIPPLINAIYNKSPMVVLVMDNEVTAMTGHQPSPSTKRPGYTPILIENIVKGLGVKFVEVIDPFNIKEVRKVLSEAIKYVKEKKEPAVVIARRRCALEVIRDLRRAGVFVPIFEVDQEKCVSCGICYNWFACPAIVPVEKGKAWIDPELCVGCAACVQVCPVKAIRPSKEYNVEEVEKFWR